MHFIAESDLGNQFIQVRGLLREDSFGRLLRAAQLRPAEAKASLTGYRYARLAPCPPRMHL